MQKNQDTEVLIKAFLSLKDRETAEKFLTDLLTKKEIKEFSLRLKTAILLQKKVSYTEIAKQTKFSSTTIARVSRWLNKGAGGYVKVINQITDPSK